MSEVGDLISDRCGLGRVIIVIAVIAILALSIAGIYVLTLPNLVPNAPSGLHADMSSYMGMNTVTLSWDAADGNGFDVIGYKIFRGNTPGDEVLLVDLGTFLSYNDTTVSNGNTYYYTVSAVNKFGEGPKAMDIVVTVNNAPPQSITANF